MAPEQTFSTSDLRGNAQDYKRAKEYKQKWAHGQAYGPGRRVADGHPRPARSGSGSNSGDRKDVQFGLNKARKHNLVVDEDVISGDSSNEDEVEEASAAPAPDAEITYSYDASRGPGHGSQILQYALTQAVERYENGVTDKLVKDEYEVLNHDGNAAVSPAKGKKATAPEDEEYEFV